MKIPNQLLGSWAGSVVGRGAATNPARVPAQPGTHASPRPWPCITGSPRKHRCSRDLEILKYLQRHSHIPYFSQLLCRDGTAVPMPTWAPQPTQVRDGDAVLRAWLFMGSEAEPDAENLHFMGNFSIYFILALEKNPKAIPTVISSGFLWRGPRGLKRLLCCLNH